MQNSECIEMFEKYLVEDKKASANTLSSYLRDIRQLGEFLDVHGENGIVDASAEELIRAVKSSVEQFELTDTEINTLIELQERHKAEFQKTLPPGKRSYLL